MEINVADQRILLLSDQISPEEARKKAWEKRTSVFDAVSRVTSFLSKPREDDFELLYEEHRYQPLWHVVAKSNYVYDRIVDHQVETNGAEVKSVTFDKKNYDVKNGHYHLSVVEHCVSGEQEELLVDGVTGKPSGDFSEYLSFSPQVVKGKIEKMVSAKSIVVPPQTRVSAIMREVLSNMIVGIQADKILEEKVEVSCIDLYYRPVYAFQYRWISKNKEAIVEVDGLTGDIKSGLRVFSEYLGRVLDQNFLFDLGADAASILVPGGSIAVKVAKKLLDTKKK